MNKNTTLVNATDPAVKGAYSLTNGYVLVRPDGYIGLITSSADDVKGYFQHLNEKLLEINNIKRKNTEQTKRQPMKFFIGCLFFET